MNDILLDRKEILKVQIYIILALFAVQSVITYYYVHGVKELYGIDYAFHVNGEANVPALFSTISILCASAVAFIAARAKSERERYRYWQLIAAVLLFLGLDEGAQLHETFADQLPIAAEGVFLGPWVAVYVPLVLVVAGFLGRFWIRLPLVPKIYLATGALLYVASAIGLEMVEASVTAVVGDENFDNTWWGLLSGIEECGEMTGVAMIMQGILAVISRSRTEVRIIFS